MKFLPFKGLKVLIGICLLAMALQVLTGHAVWGNTSDILDKRITIRVENLPINEVLNAIAIQAGCSFSYSNTLLDSNRKVTVDYNKIPLKHVLSDLLGSKLSSISVAGSRVLLLAAGGQVKGTVMVAQDKRPIPYATVKLEEAGHGTATDEDGTFEMKIPAAGTWTLIVSAIGYETASKVIKVVPGQTLMISIALRESALKMKEVVVTADRAVVSTATRTSVPIKDLPMPVMLIEGKQLEMMGSRRLNEVLQEQTGLALTTDPSGASNALGLQVQGFDASYTMIMIDGQPLIGRNAVGILDLSRITVANIERIEIIKGTSSAMYGSDALAGVVNIVTKGQHSRGTKGIASLRYGTYNTWDATLDGGTTLPGNQVSASVSANYYSTDGFDADPTTPGNTLPPFHSYSLQGKLNYHVFPSGSLTTSVRYASRNQRNRYDLDRLGQREDTNIERDLIVTGMLQNTLGKKTALNTQYYFTRYNAITTNMDFPSGEIINQNNFVQSFHRFESFANHDMAANLKLTTGIGGNSEILQASRYGDQRQMNNGFAYLQADYTPVEKLGLLAGMRYDVHNIYGWQISPRMGIRYTVNDWLTLKGTAGTGFKAPSFQQLYLSFTNPGAGYTVLGAAVFESEMDRMQEAGEITAVYPISEEIGNLEAEHSASFNAGFVLTPSPAFSLEANVFHNNIRNMIFEELVAMKQNGSQVFSYRNIEEAFTQGLETNIHWKLLDDLGFSAGYQLLFAKDKGVIDEIKAENKQVRTREGRSRTATPSDYFNLSNRSRHMANAKLFYEYKPLWMSASLRANYRGRYGLGDRNFPNNFIDPYDLFVEGYTLLNATVEKQFFQKQLSVQLICDNITDYSNHLIPNLPGRQFLVALSWRFGVLNNRQND